MRLFDVKCTRRACGVELAPTKAHRRYAGSAYHDGDPYCAACAHAINRQAHCTLVIAPWYPGLMVRRISDGAHAEVLAWDGGRDAVVRYGVAGSMSAPYATLGYRLIAAARRDEFEIVQGTNVLRETS